MQGCVLSSCFTRCFHNCAAAFPLRRATEAPCPEWMKPFRPLKWRFFFWHLATPRSLVPESFNGVDCGESSCLGSLLLASSAEGPGVPLSVSLSPSLFRPAAWLHVAANHRDYNSWGMGHSHVCTSQKLIMNCIFIKTWMYEPSLTRLFCFQMAMYPPTHTHTRNSFRSSLYLSASLIVM